MNKSISYDKQSFIIKGKRELIVSGEIHYFRIPRALWKDRLQKAKLAGLNTISTYILWSYHEPEEGRYDFNGEKDLGYFLRLCSSMGLYVIARPGPYICSEVDAGGFPAWLLTKEGLRLRRYNPIYLHYVDKWFDKLIPVIGKYQLTREGSVILVQVENEYGSFSHDDAYMSHLRDRLRKNGIEVPLITCDGAVEIPDGKVKGAVPCINLPGQALTHFGNLKSMGHKSPPLVTEFWINGMATAWGQRYDAPSAKEIERETKEIIACGAGYNYYMWAGGMNFGYMAGRSIMDDHCFISAIFNDNSPVSESGTLQAKYYPLKRLNWFVQSLSDLIAGSREDRIFKIKVTTGLKSVVRKGETGARLVAIFNESQCPCETKIEIPSRRESLPQNGMFSIEPNDISFVILDYPLFKDMVLNYAITNILRIQRTKKERTLVVYGKTDCYGEIGLKLKTKPKVYLNDEFEDVVDWDNKRRVLTIGFTYSKRHEIVIGTEERLRVIILSEREAERTWFVGEKIIFDKGYPYYVQKVSTKDVAKLTWEVSEKDLLQVTLEDSDWRQIDGPGEMTHLGKNYGYGWYQVDFMVDEGKERELFWTGAADRVTIFHNSRFIGVLDAPVFGKSLRLNLSKGRNVLMLLTDNLGRYCFGSQMGEPKGIYQQLYFGAQVSNLSTGWRYIEEDVEGNIERYNLINFDDSGWKVTGLTSVPELKRFTHLRRWIRLPEKEKAVLQMRGFDFAAEIYVNGYRAGRYPGWQSGREKLLDITTYIHRDDNLISLTFENVKNPSMFRPGLIEKEVRILSFSPKDALAGDWQFKPVEEEKILPNLKWKQLKIDAYPEQLVWFRARFHMPSLKLLKLRMDGMGKGLIWLNGRLLCRYWQIGPHEEYWLPEPWLKRDNEIIIFEEEEKLPTNVRLVTISR